MLADYKAKVLPLLQENECGNYGLFRGMSEDRLELVTQIRLRIRAGDHSFEIAERGRRGDGTSG
jgi:hypothetical protein